MKNKIVFVAAVAILALTANTEAKKPIPTPPDTPVIGELEPYLLETLYKASDNDAGLAGIVEEQPFKELVQKHDLKLFGGPMLGCVTDTSARFWVRTPGPAKVQVVVGDRQSHTVETKADDDFTGLLDVEGLKPLTSYRYDVLVNGSSVFSKERPVFRTYPSREQKARFSVGFGGGARYNPKKEKIWDVIAGHAPDAFLFLGDNVYIDNPLKRNVQRVHYQNSVLRAT